MSEPKASVNNKAASRWCFTLNNYTEEDQTAVNKFSEVCTYLIYGREVGDSGTPHLQGFFTMKKPKRLAGLKKAVGFVAHFEIAKGTSQQAADYCKKEKDYTEFGTPPVERQRTDLQEAVRMIKDKCPMKEIAEQCPETFVKFGRGLRDLQLTLGDAREHHCCRGLWIWGPPGTGKSHAARNLCTTPPYLKSQNKWWDGYNNEEIVVLDDLDTSVLGHHIKIWGDKWSCTGETKGGTVPLRHKLLIVTSNYSPEELWKEEESMCAAISRRFKIVHKTSRNELIDHVEFRDDIMDRDLDD